MITSKTVVGWALGAMFLAMAAFGPASCGGSKEPTPSPSGDAGAGGSAAGNREGGAPTKLPPDNRPGGW